MKKTNPKEVLALLHFIRMASDKAIEAFSHDEMSKAGLWNNVIKDASKALTGAFEVIMKYEVFTDKVTKEKFEEWQMEIKSALAAFAILEQFTANNEDNSENFN